MAKKSLLTKDNKITVSDNGSHAFEEKEDEPEGTEGGEEENGDEETTTP